MKFFHHGMGKADSATSYLLSKAPLQYLGGSRDAKGVVRDPAPAVVRGDPDLTRRLINQLGTKHRYVSGVLSFRELISEKDEEQIINRFEKTMFAGLQPGQYDCLWIRHSHNRRSELHFLVPRCELTSGKSLNIRPPGKQSEEIYDTFRKLCNSDFNLKDPDPKVAKISPEEIQRLRDRLDKLSAARARYNENRYPLPKETDPIKPELIHDRTRSFDGRAQAVRGTAQNREYEDEKIHERFDRAIGALGDASTRLGHASERLSSATQEFRTLAQEAVRLHQSNFFNRALLTKYQVRLPGTISVGRDEMEFDRGDDL